MSQPPPGGKDEADAIARAAGCVPLSDEQMDQYRVVEIPGDRPQEFSRIWVPAAWLKQ